MLYEIYDKSPFLRKLYNQSPFEGFLRKCVRYFYYYPTIKSRAFWQYISSIPRCFGYKDKRFLPLLSMKDKYKGKRCFITCTGPSLTIPDLELLENEYVFGMNSICLIHDKTKWKPDFFGIQDEFVYEKIKEKLHSTDNGIVFVPSGLIKGTNLTKNWIKFHCCGSYHLYEYRFDTKYFAKYSDDAYVRVYDGYSITYSLIQLATYMGFDEIYLLGADCSYQGNRHHFIETGVYDLKADAATMRLFTSYRVAKKYAEKSGIKIVNCTRGGMLEIFPRMQLEDVLSKNEKNKLVE